MCTNLSLDFSGTGTNACYIENLSSVKTWEGDQEPPYEVDNCFWHS